MRIPPSPLVPFVLLAGLAPTAAAQLARAGTPASARHTLDAEVPSLLLPAPDVAALRAEDAERDPFPFRYGAVVPFEAGIESDGRWDEVAETGAFVWRLELSSPGALSLGVLFDQFQIPEGGEVYLYDPERRTVLGAYTSDNHQPNGMLAIQPLAGDRVVVEYVQEGWVTETPRLRVGEVVHDYRGILDRLQTASKRNAICYIDINCPQGDPYQDIKRSVVEVLIGRRPVLRRTHQQHGRGRHALLPDRRPLRLDMTNVVAIFNYERTGCSSGQLLAVADPLGRHAARPLARLRLAAVRVQQRAAGESFQPFFAGWGRTQRRPPSPAIGIHHAQGLPKKISIDNQAPTNGGNMWQVVWEDGQVHGGSSGSPLFNGRKRIIGPACCVSNFNCGTQQVMYGRLDKFWNQDNLEEWLDPLATGRYGWDGYDPFNPQSIPYYGTDVNPRAYTTTLPALGSLWTATVDTSSEPAATSTVLLGHAASIPAGQIYGFGELLIDLSSTRYFTSTEPVAGGVSIHSQTIPNDPTFAGAVAYSQAFILGGGTTATNGVKLRVR